MRIFNYLYYSLTPFKVTKSKIHFDKFFYPLDLFSIGIKSMVKMDFAVSIYLTLGK